MYAVIDGGPALSGVVQVSGAKNAATRMLSAALLTDDSVELRNFPTQLVDVGHKTRFARSIGADIKAFDSEATLEVDASKLSSALLSTEELDVPIRTTYLLAAAQLVRSGIARVPFPGGCAIGGGPAGGRGYDLHIMVWESLGCRVVERFDHIEVVAPRGLVAGTIDFPISTVGGTENALLCASVASGTSEIRNAYITPEIENLIVMLRQMGAEIEISGGSHLTVVGRNGLLAGAHAVVMPDRIEALTWVVVGLLTRSTLTIKGVPFDSMDVPLIHLRNAGIDLYRSSTSLHIDPDCLLNGQVQPFELAAGVHPGVISDMAALYVTLALGAIGTSRIYDYRYPERIGFVSELAKLVDGDHLRASPGKVTVSGPARFRAGAANSTDLRGSIALVIAALCAEGRSEVGDVHMALRGYNGLEEKLRSLGANISVFEK